MPVALNRFCTVPFLLLILLATTALTSHAADDAFGASPLAGVASVQVAVSGVPDEFARYGLTASEMHERVTAQLSRYGLPVVDAAQAAREPDAARLDVRFDANRNPYAFYHYGISLRLLRKLPLGEAAAGFVATEVWSAGQHGIIEPADMKPIYGYLDALVERFVAAHGRDNPGNATAMLR